MHAGVLAIAGMAGLSQGVIRTAPRQGMGELLIQAVPGIVAIHATKPGESGDSSKPPAVPPVGNWRLRPMALPLPKEPDPMDGLFGLMFALTSTRTDDPNLLRHTESQWLRKDSVDGTEVSVALGPAIMPRRDPYSLGFAQLDIAYGKVPALPARV